MFQDTTKNQTVNVLGKTFNSEEERRNYFREELRKQLPELKKMDGFPIGEDEDILNLSDPPFYTACPNPWLNDFIAEWEIKKNELEKNGKRITGYEVVEPYATDVSEGKNEPIYNAHSYHTKVPHKAIMRYLFHYTKPGDFVYDGFSGSGMTGIAANKCGDIKELLSMGLIVNNKNEIINSNNKIGLFGSRNCIISDLSPAATNLGYNNNNSLDILNFDKIAKNLIKEARKEFSWMFTTLDPITQKEAEVEYFIWSEISTCEECGNNLNFSEIAFENDLKNLKKIIKCPSCDVVINKRNLKPQYVSKYDSIIDKVIQVPSRELILICFKRNKIKIYKKPDENDFKRLIKIDELSKPNIPTKEIPDMQMMRVGRMKSSNITHTHQFYFERMKHILSFLWDKAEKIPQKKEKELIKYWLDSHFVNLSYRNRYRPNVSFPYNPMTGVFYIPMMSSEANPFVAYENKLKRIALAFANSKDNGSIILSSTNSASNTIIKNNSIDYIFTDPPFGENIYYSDLNYFIESWQKVYTNTNPEAIVDKVKKKGELEYNKLIENCFKEYYRVLKPGKWMTVVFSNTKASIWNGIQLSLSNAGFVTSNVSALDKQQGTFQAVNTTTAVQQDLVISCYKPSSEFDEKFKLHHKLDIAIWDFVEEHLNHLPIHLIKENATAGIIERSPKILFDRLISFYLQKGLPVPIDAGKFQQGLRERFIERDGMYFTDSQIHKYDKKKAEIPNFVQLNIFVSNEQDSIYWLRNLLEHENKTEQDIHPLWMKEVASNMRSGDILPEMRTILEENFLKDNTGKWYIPNPESEIDLEKLRSKRLLKQFETYKSEVLKPKGKLKEVRVEALRTGFKQCYQDKDFKTIVVIGDRIPNNLLMEDEVLLQFYDIASSRI
jgi:DNA modification methylase